MAFRDGDWWSEFLYVKQLAGNSGVPLLRMIEDALSEGAVFQDNEEWNLEGTLDGYASYSGIKDWESLADGYLLLDDLSGAFRAWSRLVEVIGPNEVTQISATALLRYAHKLGVEIDDCSDE